MKQWSFIMEKHLNPWIINWTDQCIFEKLHRKKPFVIYTAIILPNIEKVEIPCLHNRVALLMKRREWGARNLTK